MFVRRCHHELRGPVHCVGDLGREVSGLAPARAGVGVVAHLGRSGAGTSHDGRIRSRPGGVSAGVRAGGHRPSCRHSCPDRLVKESRTRPSLRGPKVVVLDSGSGLANATLQQRLVPVRLFYDFLGEEGARAFNPVGRGRYTAGRLCRKPHAAQPKPSPVRHDRLRFGAPDTRGSAAYGPSTSICPSGRSESRPGANFEAKPITREYTDALRAQRVFKSSAITRTASPVGLRRRISPAGTTAA